MTLQFDAHSTERIRQAGVSTLWLWIFFATYGIWVFGGLMIALALFGVLSWWNATVPIVLTHGITLLTQKIIHRERPPLAIAKIRMWVRTSSFPSAHAAGAMAFALVMSAGMLSWGTVGIICSGVVFLFAFAIGFSRIVVGVHFLTDVIFGIIFGGFIAGAFLFFL